MCGGVWWCGLCRAEFEFAFCGRFISFLFIPIFFDREGRREKGEGIEGKKVRHAESRLSSVRLISLGWAGSDWIVRLQLVFPAGGLVIIRESICLPYGTLNTHNRCLSDGIRFEFP